MMQKIGSLFFLSMFLLTFPATAKVLNTGRWRFEQTLALAKVPFIIELDWQGNRLVGTLHNGKEKITLNDISIRDKKITIPLQTYQHTLELVAIDENTLAGSHIRHNKTPEVKTPVQATYGIAERFPGEKKEAQIKLTGKWEATLTDEENRSSQGVVVFEQDGNKLHGSILTPTGDYRYFEGYVSGHEFEAASFDGVFSYVFKGRLAKNKLIAAILSNSEVQVKATRNEKARLPDPYKHTQVSSLKFSFPNFEGKQVSLSDPQFKNKPVIVQIFGSWCPNCMDEMNFLVPWYEENKDRGIEVMALAFERSLNQADAKRQLQKVQKKQNVTYPLLLAGSTADEKPSDKLPIKNFISFPTTIFLNKNHEVVRVHAGFSGPGTGEFFEVWKKEFNQTVDELLK